VSAGAAERPTLALLGLRCSGKSTVGRLLAQSLGLAFVDHDEETLRFGVHAGWKVGSVGELLERAGQARFRELEAVALRRLLEPMPRLVLATGGGVVERPDNRTWLARTARCVFLSVAPEVLAERLRRDPTPRPALLGADPAGADPAGADPAAELAELGQRREPLYRALAEVVVECGLATPEELAQRIRVALFGSA
jgi:shikimate kinase